MAEFDHTPKDFDEATLNELDSYQVAPDLNILEAVLEDTQRHNSGADVSMIKAWPGLRPHLYGADAFFRCVPANPKETAEESNAVMNALELYAGYISSRFHQGRLVVIQDPVQRFVRDIKEPAELPADSRPWLRSPAGVMSLMHDSFGDLRIGPIQTDQERRLRVWMFKSVIVLTKLQRQESGGAI